MFRGAIGKIKRTLQANPRKNRIQSTKLLNVNQPQNNTGSPVTDKGTR
jgi:hypothetical protein